MVLKCLLNFRICIIYFLDFIKDIISVLSDIEKIRCELSLKNDFCLQEIFRLMEKDKQGFITLFDLKIGFNQFELYPTNNELELIFQRYQTINQNLPLK